jgi:hypothetical protein
MTTTRKPPLVIPEAKRLPDEIPCRSQLGEQAWGQAPIRCGNSNVQYKAMLPKCRGCSVQKCTTTLPQSGWMPTAATIHAGSIHRPYAARCKPPYNCPGCGPPREYTQTTTAIVAKQTNRRTHTAGTHTRADKAHRLFGPRAVSSLWDAVRIDNHLTIRKNQP